MKQLTRFDELPEGFKEAYRELKDKADKPLWLDKIMAPGLSDWVRSDDK